MRGLRGKEDAVLEDAPVVTAQRPLVARVNLLPPEVRESGRVRRAQAGLLAGVLLAGGTVTMGTLSANESIAAARSDLSAAQAARVGVETRVGELAPVSALYGQVDAAEQLVASARSAEIAWSGLLHDLSIQIPADIWIESMSVAPATAGAADSGGDLGTITYVGRGRSHNDVATWIETLEAHPALAGATFSASAVDTSTAEKTVTFTATANLASEALRNGDTQ